MTTENPNAAAIRINASTVKVVVVVLAFCGGLGGGLWTAAAWKTNVDDHLQRIEEHLRNEDENTERIQRQTEWLVKHNKDASEAPMTWEHDGHSQLIPPIAEAMPQLSGLPPGVTP